MSLILFVEEIVKLTPICLHFRNLDLQLTELECQHFEVSFTLPVCWLSHTLGELLQFLFSLHLFIEHEVKTLKFKLQLTNFLCLFCLDPISDYQLVLEVLSKGFLGCFSIPFVEFLILKLKLSEQHLVVQLLLVTLVLVTSFVIILVLDWVSINVELKVQFALLNHLDEVISLIHYLETFSKIFHGFKVILNLPKDLWRDFKLIRGNKKIL